MSFSRDSKIEILQNIDEDFSSAIAMLSGLFHSCGEIEKKDGKIYIKIVSDIKELFGYVKDLIKKFYGDEVLPEVAENYNINKNIHYEISFEIEKFKNMLIDAGVIDFDDGLKINFDIDKNLILEENSRRAFIKGVYIGASTSSIKLSADAAQSCGSGYHMEFSSPSHQFLIDFSNILAEFNTLRQFAIF